MPAPGPEARAAEADLSSPRAAPATLSLVPPAAAVTLRRGGTEDAPALAAFAARTFEETFAADNRPEDMRAHLAAHYGAAQQGAELADPSVATLLAVAGSELLAYAQVRRGPAPPCVTAPDAVELHRFYVDRTAHGTGLAARLMQAARQAAVDFGAGHLWLGVWERNPRAIAFYGKCGFVDVGSTIYCVGPDEQTDRVLLATLAPAGRAAT